MRDAIIFHGDFGDFTRPFTVHGSRYQAEPRTVR